MPHHSFDAMARSEAKLIYLDRKSTRPELQSQSNLVCRLLLEKKKKKNTIYTHVYPFICAFSTTPLPSISLALVISSVILDSYSVTYSVPSSSMRSLQLCTW